VEHQEVLQVLQMQVQAELVEMEKELQLDLLILELLEVQERSQAEVVLEVEATEWVISQAVALYQIMVD
jgi:hypothetical protein